MSSLESTQAAPAFGAMLRTFRTNAGLSQEALAESAGISVSAIGAIEQGIRRAPYRETVAQLARALSLSLSDRAAFGAAADRARARLRGPKPHAAALSAPKHDPAPPLPASFNAFVERPERTELEAHVNSHRLTTVSGPGGIGKTRTTIEALERGNFGERGPMWFVDLSTVSDEALVIVAIAAGIGAGTAPDRDPLDATVDVLREGGGIVVLDNAERLVATLGPILTQLLRRCERARFVVTSREPLGLTSEYVYRLPPPLALADTELRPSAAVALFVERAAAAGLRAPFAEEDIDVVREICRRLDGIPLAIELAAPHAAALGVDELCSRLSENFVLAGGSDLPKRHRTLTSTIAWSYDSLDPREALVFRRLSIFSVCFSLEAAEFVCTAEIVPARTVAEIVGSLVRKSLVNVNRVKGTTRHSMLESIRAFASAKRDAADECEETARLHASWFAHLADREERARTAAGKADLENIRRAAQWAADLGTLEGAHLAARILIGFRRLWERSGNSAEHLQRIETVLDRIAESSDLRLLARLNFARSNHLFSQAYIDAAPAIAALGMSTGEREGVVAIQQRLGVEWAKFGRYDEAESAFAIAKRILDEGVDNPVRYVQLLSSRAWVRSQEGRLAEAREDIADLQAFLRGNPRGVEFDQGTTAVLAEIEFADGNVERAIALSQEYLASADNKHWHVGRSDALLNLSNYLAISGDSQQADRVLREALERWPLYGMHGTSYLFVQAMALLTLRRGDAPQAARFAGCSKAVRERRKEGSFWTGKRHLDVLMGELQASLSAAELQRFMDAGTRLHTSDVRDQYLAKTPETAASV